MIPVPFRPPRFLTVAARVAAKDLALEGRTRESLSAMALFSLVVLVLFDFAFESGQGPERLLAAVLWVTFAFAAIVGFTRSFQIERDQESLTGLALAPVDAGAVYAGKAAANLATVSALELVLVPLAAVLFDVDLTPVAGPLIAVLLLHTLGLAAVGTLLAAVSARLGRGETLVAVLLLPVATPLFLSAVRCTTEVLARRPLAGSTPWLLVAGGLDVLYFLLALLTFEFVIEE